MRRATAGPPALSWILGHAPPVDSTVGLVGIEPTQLSYKGSALATEAQARTAAMASQMRVKVGPAGFEPATKRL